MTTWRMAFRWGSKGPELWPECKRRGVAAMSYEGIDDIDLSQYPKNEPIDQWSGLSASQKSSLKHVAYDMAKGDVIYVKQGTDIVGRGKVLGPYVFRPNKNKYFWPHQVPVAWESDFTKFRLLLGGEPHTVLRLAPKHISMLKAALSSVADDKKREAREGELVRRTLIFRKRNRSIIEDKKRKSTGACEACGTSLKSFYDLKGKDCLQVHHKNPISEQRGAIVTKISDLAIFCPNCHAVTHAFDPALKFKQLKKMIRSPKEREGSHLKT